MMAESSQVTLTIPATSEFVGVVRLAVSGIASRLNFSVDDIEDIKIAISEACTNAVQHAYEDRETGDIKITCTISDDMLNIEVSDIGNGFDTNILGSKEQKENSQKKLGLGLGLTFIKNLMDTSDIESKKGVGTTVTMSKKRQHQDSR